MEHRVVAAVLVRVDTVLLCHRSPDRRWYPGVWDLPGGHIDDGESPAEALVRELAEELSITIAEPTGDPNFLFSADETSIVIWSLESWAGEPTNIAQDEHDEIGWFTALEVEDLDLADPKIAQICRDALAGFRCE